MGKEVKLPENEKKGENIIDSLKKNVKKLLPRRIEFVLAKTAVGAKARSVDDEVYTRQEEPLPEKETKEKEESNQEEELLLFKKTKSKGHFGEEESRKKPSLVTASKATQLVSNSARDWLNLPKRTFANPEPSNKSQRVVSKPLPSAEEFAQEAIKKEFPEKKELRQVFSSMLQKKRNPETDALDWDDSEKGFEEQIESSRREVLKEWEEMRKPDEWDMALDQGKSKKVRKNKIANKRHRKNNPFQEMAQKKQKRSF